MKAAIYSRFSTDRQNESSISDQVRVCTEYAERQGWQIGERFEDQGISGAALGNRPGVLRMRESGFAGHFEVLLVCDLNRLARSEDLPPLVSRLRFRGVRIIGVQDGFDSSARTARMQAGMSAIMGGEFIEMVRARTYSALESRAKQGRATGGKAYGYRDGKVDKGEADIVQEIFGRFADGASCRATAADLNSRRIQSPGSSWNRTVRRTNGWMGSAIRAMLRNERYRGVVHWNASEWRKDPDTGKRKRVNRPRSEWISHVDESLRIVGDDLWARVQRRIKSTAEDKHWAAPKGKPKYLLSGLLRCAECGAHYVIANAFEYSCSSFVNGRACQNNTRVKRTSLEDQIVVPVHSELLQPERTQRMAKEMQAYYLEKLGEVQSQAAKAPRELHELDARIDRLRDRLQRGDPDMPADEIQAVIDRAHEKRRELEAQQPDAKQSAKVLSILPRAAEEYRRQIIEGLDGDPRAALKARVILRELFGGRIDLKPEGDGELWAEYALQPAALIQVVGNRGSGGRI